MDYWFIVHELEQYFSGSWLGMAVLYHVSTKQSKTFFIRKCVNIRKKLWLGDLSTWHLATATMKACEYFLPMQWRKYKMKMKQFFKYK